MDRIDLDAIIREIYDEDKGKTHGRAKFKLIARECIRQVLELAADKASLTRYFPDEGYDTDGLPPDEDNYEASYKSPYKEDSGCTIWVNKQSILNVIDLIK